jgi:hypothetical protein
MSWEDHQAGVEQALAAAEELGLALVNVGEHLTNLVNRTHNAVGQSQAQGAQDALGILGQMTDQLEELARMRPAYVEAMQSYRSGF